ncbi:hypothetical protein GCK32_013011 [Trichostrongylus colubriformis]|uniref:Uncharacterized protein n=1 Tax=Trichostrongylus colubriformis TaxID=6319 RepID=A0AAN8IK22_TRICO
MLRWTAVILRFTMIVTCSAWNLNNVMDRWRRGLENDPNYQEVVRFAEKGLFTKSCEELRNIDITTYYIPARPNDEKDMCQVHDEALECRRKPSLLHDKNWLEKTLREYQMQATQDHVRKTVQCLLSNLNELMNKRSTSGTSHIPHSTEIHETSPLAPMTVSTFAHTPVHPTSNVITTAMADLNVRQ